MVVLLALHSFNILNYIEFFQETHILIPQPLLYNDLLLHIIGLNFSHFARHYYGNLIFDLFSNAT